MSERRFDAPSTFEYEEPEVETVRARNCSTCGVPIPLERLEALPNTTTCTEHSHEQAKIGFLVFDHKTAPRFITIDPRDKEALRRAQRCNRRSR